MRTYMYDAITLRHIGWVEVADASGYEGKPGYTTIAPPDMELAAGSAIGWIDGAWCVAEDRVGQVWHDPSSGEVRTIAALGELIPGGWVSGAPPLSDLPAIRQSASKRVDRAREARIASGIEHTFSGMTERVQTRPIDLRNLQSVQGTALALSIQGVTAASIPFRVESNADYMLTPAQALAMCAAVAAWGTACYQWAWALKADINAAANEQAVAQILESL